MKRCTLKHAIHRTYLLSKFTLRDTKSAHTINILDVDKKVFIPKHNSCRKWVCRNVQLLHGCLDVSYRSWDKSKNACPCRNRTSRCILRAWEAWGRKLSAFKAPMMHRVGKMDNFHKYMSSCYISTVFDYANCHYMGLAFHGLHGSCQSWLIQACYLFFRWPAL